jgi:hypothetical protein
VYPEIIAGAKLQAGLRLRNPGQRSSDVACAAQGGFETRPYMRRRQGEITICAASKP